jgi:hypothetical protein
MLSNQEEKSYAPPQRQLLAEILDHYPKEATLDNTCDMISEYNKNLLTVISLFFEKQIAADDIIVVYAAVMPDDKKSLHSMKKNLGSLQAGIAESTYKNGEIDYLCNVIDTAILVKGKMLKGEMPTMQVTLEKFSSQKTLSKDDLRENSLTVAALNAEFFITIEAKLQNKLSKINTEIEEKLDASQSKIGKISNLFDRREKLMLNKVSKKQVLTKALYTIESFKAQKINSSQLLNSFTELAIESSQIKTMGIKKKSNTTTLLQAMSL